MKVKAEQEAGFAEQAKDRGSMFDEPNKLAPDQEKSLHVKA